jgi:hypothetical protein
MFNLEKEPQFRQEQEIEKNPEVEKMESFMEKMAFELKKEGIPVDKDCRLDLESFKGVYPSEELEKNKKLVEEREKEFYKTLLEKGLSLKECKEERKKRIGEKMEMLTTGIFYKNLNKDFIVVRSSIYDDIINGVDNIIVERKTGNIVCALDEVGENFGIEYEKKKDKVLRKNIETNGVNVKYGFRVKQEKDKMKLELGERKNIPIFYLALPEEYIKKVLKSFQPSLKEQSDDERKLFSYFIATMDSQAKALELGYESLHPTLRKRLRHFANSIEKFKIEK